MNSSNKEQNIKTSKRDLQIDINHNIYVNDNAKWLYIHIPDAKTKFLFSLVSATTGKCPRITSHATLILISRPVHPRLSTNLKTCLI